MPSHGDLGVDLTGRRTPNLTQPDQWLPGFMFNCDINKAGFVIIGRFVVT
jgi:hypothetical protein